MSETDIRSGIKYGWQFGETNWNVDMDANLVRLGRFGFHLSAISVADSPSDTPSNGDTHIVGSTPSGAFSGEAKDSVAVFDGAWDFEMPRPGWLCYNFDTGKLMVYTASGWDNLN